MIFSYALQVVMIWYAQPEGMVEGGSIVTFKRLLDKYLKGRYLQADGERSG